MSTLQSEASSKETGKALWNTFVVVSFDDRLPIQKLLKVRLVLLLHVEGEQLDVAAHEVLTAEAAFQVTLRRPRRRRR